MKTTFVFIIKWHKPILGAFFNASATITEPNVLKNAEIKINAIINMLIFADMALKCFSLFDKI